VTLILIAILALAAVELFLFLRPKLSVSRELLQRTLLVNAASTGIDYARSLLLEDLENSEFDSLEEPWNEPVEYALDRVEVKVRIEDEERRFPLAFLIVEPAAAAGGQPSPAAGTPAAKPAVGTAPAESGRTDTGIKLSEVGLEAFETLLKRLGLTPNWAKEAVDSLADWIDGDDDPRSFGAEKDYYAVNGYQARNGLPDNLGELALVKGFRPDITEKVFPYLTVFSKRLNLNTAPAEVLESMFGKDESLPIDFLVNGRPYESTADALKLAQIDPKFYNQLQKMLTVSSSVFSVRSTARDESGRQESVYAIIERNEKGGRILYWQRLQPPDDPLP